MAVLIIRRLSDRQEVGRVELSSTNPRSIEKVMMGILRQMDTDSYFIDDSEVEGA